MPNTDPKKLACGAYWYVVPGKDPEICEKRDGEAFVRFTNGSRQDWARDGENFIGPLARPRVAGQVAATLRKSKPPAKPLNERIADADARGGAWLAKGNELAEAGDKAQAQRCYDKVQFWLDRSNKLRGNC
ncbi:hypothetical protein [Acidovorax sp. sic0104]|uniref:hypothetical protein n=1 Tax=Acidovorax sp. sic0104 TaxID=2854784 RepID=UPI001C45A4E5|nr:hypothetical protein [Acidovorax sp. sic0104]MBV7542214.1 hypothetical protein [Acidovorax sp. sic0104]